VSSGELTEGGISAPPVRGMAAALEAAIREEGGRVLALLARRYGDLDLAEEAVATALENAVRTWPRDGVPTNPGGWLLVAARRAAIDRLRHEAGQTRRALGAAGDPTVAVGHPAREGNAVGWEGVEGTPDGRLLSGGVIIPDERLRLILLCTHPALDRDAQVALTLRLVLGLSTTEIAAAYLVPETTLAQRIVRAKRKIKAAAIPLSLPADLTDRLEAVLSVIYLVFTEGHFSAGGDSLTRVDLAAEALRLVGLLDGLLPSRPDVLGLRALMTYHHSRRDARTDGDGELVLLDAQDRSTWRQDEIAHANAMLGRAMLAAPPSRYVLMAVIAGLHANAATPEHTDWASVVSAYDSLLTLDPSPVVALNRAVALAAADTPAAGLRALESIAGLRSYHAWHVARGDLLARSGRAEPARAAFADAVALAVNESQRRFLQRRLRD